MVDSVIQEIDIATGLVTFEWHSLGNIPLRESFSRPRPGTPFDYAHTNSVNLDTDGDFLMSARNTWAGYKIDRETGRIRWRLGGKRSTFRLPARRASRGSTTSTGARTARSPCSTTPPSRPCASSRARWRSGSTRRAGRRGCSRATAHPRRLLAATQGNQQTLPNGNFLVGWGSQRQLTEYDAAGNVLFNAALSLGYESYRSLPHAVGRAAAHRGRWSRRRTSRARAPTPT